ncbi:nitrogen fixation protein NifQ [Campylobacterota bacterium]
MKQYQIMENEIMTLLQRHAVDEHAEKTLAPWVAAKSLEMHHMYEDLGFASRSQMGKFMKEHFYDLAMKKPKDKLWKKFLYDEIGQIAPACEDCHDQLTCFRCMVSEVSA